MKCRERHVVYLSARAVEILDRQAGQSDKLVFPSAAGGDASMSNMRC
jgi:integrase